VHHYEHQLLHAGDWRVVTRDALRELFPGAIAGAAHGWLRTAHAIFLLARRDTEARRRELAHALASWAARYERLPGTPGARPVLGLDPAGTLASVPVLAASKRRDALLLFERTRAVAGLPGFAAAVEAVDLDALEIEDAIGALAAACARAFLASPEEGRFAYLHTITSASALRLALPALDEESGRRALGAVFQVAAALHATNAAEGASVAPVTVRAVGREEIAARLGETVDDHEVKIIVAALREESGEVRAAAGVGWGADGSVTGRARARRHAGPVPRGETTWFAGAGAGADAGAGAGAGAGKGWAAEGGTARCATTPRSDRCAKHSRASR
jgi:hypothetical protein